MSNFLHNSRVLRRGELIHSFCTGYAQGSLQVNAQNDHIDIYNCLHNLIGTK